MGELPRNKETGEPDRDQVFQQSDENVFDVQRADQTTLDLVTGKCSDYSADGAQNRPNDQRLTIGGAKADAAKSTRENAGASWNAAVRFGVEGCRSRNNSNRARNEKIRALIIDPMKASKELLRFSQPR